jgi:hypothetical protein
VGLLQPFLLATAGVKVKVLERMPGGGGRTSTSKQTASNSIGVRPFSSIRVCSKKSLRRLEQTYARRLNWSVWTHNTGSFSARAVS